MSVLKAMRGESAMQFVETARKLEAHAFSVCMKAPKRYGPLLTNRIFELCSTVHEEVRSANNIIPKNQHEAQKRRDHLTDANCALQNIGPKLTLLYDAILQNPEKCPWIDNARPIPQRQCELVKPLSISLSRSHFGICNVSTYIWKCQRHTQRRVWVSIPQKAIYFGHNFSNHCRYYAPIRSVFRIISYSGDFRHPKETKGGVFYNSIAKEVLLPHLPGPVSPAFFMP